MSELELRVPTCNLTRGRGAYSEGSKAYLLQNGWGRYRLLIRSRSGRWIVKWEAAANVDNWRVTTVVPESSEHRHLSIRWQGLSDEDAQRSIPNPG